MGCPPLIVGGPEDHVHILCRFSRGITIADFLKGLKKESSAWLKKKNPSFSNFYWQNGYGTFSISPADVSKLRQYVARQDEHHRKESFKDEFRRLLRKYSVEFDERYVWD
jgi:REP element-mobilizing transposase RayT